MVVHMNNSCWHAKGTKRKHPKQVLNERYHIIKKIVLCVLADRYKFVLS